MSNADSESSAGTTRNAWFLTTHWSQVLEAGVPSSPEAQQALDELCRAYWHPLYAFARRQGQSPEDAEDLTQAFLAQVIVKRYLADACREKGRFRTFLLTAFKRFAANEWDRQHARKRGGFQVRVPIDPALAEARLAADPGHHLAPDVLYERQWALTLLEAVMTELEREYVASGRAALFERLRPYLAREEAAAPYAVVAAQMGLTEAAIKMAVQRLRARYRELLRAHIARTVATPAEIEDELRHLFAAFDP